MSKTKYSYHVKELCFKVYVIEINMSQCVCLLLIILRSYLTKLKMSDFCIKSTCISVFRFFINSQLLITPDNLTTADNS